MAASYIGTVFIQKMLYLLMTTWTWMILLRKHVLFTLYLRNSDLITALNYSSACIMAKILHHFDWQPSMMHCQCRWVTDSLNSPQVGIFNNQKPGWNCVCVLLCCFHPHYSGSRCHDRHYPQNTVLFHLWTLLCHPGYRCQSLCHHGYCAASLPALGALWLQSVANGDHLSRCPIEGEKWKEQGL